MRKHRQPHRAGSFTKTVYDMKEFMTRASLPVSGFRFRTGMIMSGAHIKPGFYWSDVHRSDYYKVLYLSDHTRCRIRSVAPASDYLVYWGYTYEET